jgi:hypothetical protein
MLTVQSDCTDHTVDMAWDHTRHVECVELSSDDVVEDDMAGDLAVGLRGPI